VAFRREGEEREKTYPLAASVSSRVLGVSMITLKTLVDVFCIIFNLLYLRITWSLVTSEFFRKWFKRADKTSEKCIFQSKIEKVVQFFSA